MKKGITLIELLSVLVILSIVLTIVMPQIFLIIEKSQEEIILKNDEIVIKATKSYLIQEKHLFPTQIGNTKEITVLELKENNYLKEIKNPKNKNEDCNGYILITKTEDNNFDYTPHINCEKNIANAEEDKLISHYKISNFQEPTINEISNMNYISWLGNLKIGESINRSASRDGITTIIRFTRLQEHRFKAEVIEGGYYFIYSLTGGGYDWSNGGMLSANILEYYEAPGSTGRVGLGRSSSGTSSLHGFNGLGFKNAFIGNLENSSVTISLRTGNSWVMPGSYIVFENIQLERKSYYTPYTKTTRQAYLLDYSLNNNHSIINIENAPRYIEESLLFNGVDKYIEVPTSNLPIGNSQRTISAWIKPNSAVGRQAFLSYGNNSDFRDWNFEVNVWADGDINGSLGVHLGQASARVNNVVSQNIGKWMHVVSTLPENGKVQDINIYVNGVKQDVIYFNGNNNVNTAISNLNVGRRYNNIQYYNGNIDNIRIYNRELNETEIHFLYKIGR